MNDLITDNLDPGIDENKDYLSELVGDGKKFRDPKDLAKGKYKADIHISNLERENAEMRTEFLKLKEDNQVRARLEDLVDQLTKQQLASSERTLAANEDVQQMPSLDPNKLAELVDTRLSKREQERKYEENANMVRNRLMEQYGTDYQNVLKQNVEKLGLDKQFVNSLARERPEVLFKLLGTNERKETFETPPRSNVRSTFVPKTEERTWSFYQKMKKEDPTRYWKPQTQLQMVRDAETQGDKFQDGDYGLLNH